jgi:hypothetical protein
MLEQMEVANPILNVKSFQQCEKNRLGSHSRREASKQREQGLANAQPGGISTSAVLKGRESISCGRLDSNFLVVCFFCQMFQLGIGCLII